MWYLCSLSRPGGGVLPLCGILQMCHLTGIYMVPEKIALHKGPHLKFCLTKGSLFDPKSALQKGPFLPDINVLPLKSMFCQLIT